MPHVMFLSKAGEHNLPGEPFTNFLERKLSQSVEFKRISGPAIKI